MKRIRLVEAAPKYIAMKDGRRFPVSVEYNEVPDDWQGGVHPDTYTIDVNGQSIEVDAIEAERQCVAKGLSRLGYQLAESLRHARHEAFSPKTVRIGDQIWMAENLALDDGGKGIYLNEKNGESYYTWDAAVRIAKSIPGWHLPEDDEWVEAAKACGATRGSDGRYAGAVKGDYVGAAKLKSKLNINLVGYRFAGSFYSLGSHAIFWTATEAASAAAYVRYFTAGTTMGSTNNIKNSDAFSARLIKD